jgi:hypothetical protein
VRERDAADAAAGTRNGQPGVLGERLPAPRGQGDAAELEAIARDGS